ncbi:MAG: L-rhamnose mutarotase [Halobacteriaceae archaeon]
MPRVAFLQRLKPDRVDDYVEAHQDVPTAVTDTMADADVEWFDVFVRDEIAVCVLSVADPERFADTYERAMAENETIADWERLNNGFKREGMDGDGIPWMERVWTAEFD